MLLLFGLFVLKNDRLGGGGGGVFFGRVTDTKERGGGGKFKYQF